MKFALFLLVLMFGIFVQSAVGFGGPLLAMPLGIVLAGMGVAKPVCTIAAWLTGVIVFATEFKHINWKELLKMGGVMMVGVLLGLWLTGKVKLNFLLLFYAVVVTAIGVKKLFFPGKQDPPKAVQGISLGIAGLMQGLFVSGGSFLAVYSVARIKEKREFRATVGSVWAILNTVMITMYFFDGTMNKEIAVKTAIALIPTVAAVFLGGLFAKKLKQETFLKLVYVILIASGIVLFITNL